MHATMQDAHISPQQICTLKVMFRALCILECACGIQHSCTCKCVHVVSLWKTQRYHGNAEQSIQKERERDWGGDVSLALHHLEILTL